MLKPISIAVISEHDNFDRLAKNLANKLGLGLVSCDRDLTDFDLLLSVGDKLNLKDPKQKKQGGVLVDFLAPKLLHRSQFPQIKKEDLAKAIGLNKKKALKVLDTSAGLGKDSFILARLGGQVTLLERNPIVASLLEDGLYRAKNSSLAQVAVSNMQLYQQDAVKFLDSKAPKSFDVIYLDPMFPSRNKTAAVKKEMQILQKLLGADMDSSVVLKKALGIARYRVVVKRPAKSQDLSEIKPSYRISGKVTRFDIYSIKP